MSSALARATCARKSCARICAGVSSNFAIGSPALTRCQTTATQTTRPAMTLATRASVRLTTEPGILLCTDIKRVVTVPTCTGTGGPTGWSAAYPVRVVTMDRSDASNMLIARRGIAAEAVVARTIAAGTAAAAAVETEGLAACAVAGEAD